ncbi:MAG: hypothetical protein AAFN77_13545 [Planctomycetota bacterium]
MADHYASSREKIAEKLTFASEQYNHHTANLNYTLKWLNWSDLAQEIAIQAALQAAMMGVASKVCGAIAASNEAAASAQLATSWKVFAPLIKGIYKVQTIASQVAVRIAIGCTAVVVKKGYGKFYRDEDFFDMSLLKGLAVASLCGVIANIPGKTGTSWTTGAKAPHLKSLQTLVQGFGIQGAVNHWKSNPRNKELVKLIRQKKSQIVSAATDAAAEIAMECVNWGIEVEPEYLTDAKSKLSKVDFKTQLNLATRFNDWFSDVKIVNILKDQSLKCVEADARLSLWLTISQSLREIEKERMAFVEQLSELV